MSLINEHVNNNQSGIQFPVPNTKRFYNHGNIIIPYINELINYNLNYTNKQVTTTSLLNNV